MVHKNKKHEIENIGAFICSHYRELTFMYW